MSLFVEFLRFILCCHTEHFVDGYEYDDTHSSSDLPPISSIFSSVPRNPPKSSSSASSLKGPPSLIGPSSSSPKPPPTSKPVIYPTTSHAVSEERKTDYILKKGATSLFASSISNLPPSSSSSSPVLPNPPKSSPKPSASSLKGPPPTFKPVLYPTTTSTPGNEERKLSYMLEKGTSPIFAIPEYIKGQIKENIVPEILKQPLSPSTYKAYFTALLYAEEFYLEKWSDFLLKNVTLEFHEAAVYKESTKYKNLSGNLKKKNKTFVVFEIDSIPGRRPFLLSRDLVYARPLGKDIEPFQGFIYRVVKSTRVLVEFGDDFHSQHYASRKYDISFSFNRVCLKRAHEAVETMSNPSVQNFLFPEYCVSRKEKLSPPTLLPANHQVSKNEVSAIRHISSFRGSPPYLLSGSLCVVTAMDSKELSRTGIVVQEAVCEIYRSSPECLILICAPTNNTCDVLTRSLKKVILESDMFRANAAFREMDGVPADILRSCPIKGECFTCPSLQKLRKFRVILSTFVSSFRLHNEGIPAGHFSHIFLVDASLAMEPEAVIPLANFATDKTAVIVTGASTRHSARAHSDIARKYGLGKSLFNRLHENRLYSGFNPMFITQLAGFQQ
ncbi:probable RNA helicase SDE3 isoform X2 [Juglans microcarpa x Juglans regia]|uniref:probable RNA helicase SDE3 isoform X2 n=1 Tax=Juglans microcarpa x Juglans regia TaxID=2249226 RepID=UPI001B7DE656|nr:probable RNA helicase SDE3 isoform X2 [Juglans microcarpa x Juglans regia]